MRRIVFAAVISLISLPGFAQELPKAGVEAVISDQISAFQADDFDRAFSFASPMIQRLFRDADIFGDMVRRGYPMVWRPSDVRFGDLRADGPAFYQEVLIEDAQGTLHALEYEMVPVGNSFVINGVQFLQPPQIGA